MLDSAREARGGLWKAEAVPHIMRAREEDARRREVDAIRFAHVIKEEARNSRS